MNAPVDAGVFFLAQTHGVKMKNLAYSLCCGAAIVGLLALILAVYVSTYVWLGQARTVGGQKWRAFESERMGKLFMPMEQIEGRIIGHRVRMVSVDQQFPNGLKTYRPLKERVPCPYPWEI